MKSKFKLGGNAAVSAGPVGREVEASTDLQLKGGILAYSRSRGLFAGVKLEGAVISPNRKGNLGLYEKDLSVREILMENKAGPTKAGKRLIKSLTSYR